MSVMLSDLSYAFRVEGTDGGLDSLDLKFVAGTGAQDDAHAAGAAMQVLTDRYVEVLDRLFAEDVLTGGREPMMDDSFGTVDVGYRYSGSWRKRRRLWPGANGAERLAKVFGVADPDMRGGDDTHVRLSASVTLSMPRNREALQDAEIRVHAGFDHRVNACLFRFTQALDGLEVSDRAAEETALLDRALALDWDRPGQDHYRALAKAAPTASPEGEAAT